MMYVVRLMKLKINVDYVIYFVALFFLVASNLLCNVSFVSNYLVLFRLFSYLLFLYDGLLTIIKKKNISTKVFFLIIVVFAVSFVIYIKTATTILLDMFFVLFGSYNKEFYKLLKYDLIIKIVMTFIIIISYILGFAESEFVVSRDNLYIRESYGFYHPNTFGMYIMMIFFEFVVLNRNKKSIYFSLLGIASIIFIYCTSNSRTSYISIILLLCLIFLVNIYERIFKKKHEFKLKFAYQWSFLILTILAYVLTRLYSLNIPIIISLDEFLSNRLYLQALNLDAYHISLFGDNIEVIRTLDNAFMKLLINYGLLSIVFFSIIYKLIFSKAINKKNVLLVFVLLVLLYFSFSESYALYIYYNIFYVYAVTLNKNGG